MNQQEPIIVNTDKSNRSRIRIDTDHSISVDKVDHATLIHKIKSKKGVNDYKASKILCEGLRKVFYQLTEKYPSYSGVRLSKKIRKGVKISAQKYRDTSGLVVKRTDEVDLKELERLLS